MRPEHSFIAAEDDIAALNARFGDASAEEVLSAALSGAVPGPVAMVSSFGADSVVLLHLLSRLDPATPVLFIDTEMLFPETLAYQREVAGDLGLTGVRVVGPDRDELFEHDPDGDLHRRDPDLCCDLRKTRPLDRALVGYAGWITGRKRFQGGMRETLEHFERDAAGRIKVNPLAHWGTADIAEHIERHALPRHPLVAKGYPSIGCRTCTTRIEPGEDLRAGRWRGRDKDECGIHLVNGRFVRTGAAKRTEDAA